MAWRQPGDAGDRVPTLSSDRHRDQAARGGLAHKLTMKLAEVRSQKGSLGRKKPSRGNLINVVYPPSTGSATSFRHAFSAQAERLLRRMEVLVAPPKQRVLSHSSRCAAGIRTHSEPDKASKSAALIRCQSLPAQVSLGEPLLADGGFPGRRAKLIDDLPKLHDISTLRCLRH